ncbi:DUF1269 domain-containing protein [Acidovorax sp. A1169]|uniref:DUF1269 domain-containing protein n=1 Tax=Acidovorax sp. A1169 TaxID=3059524 RepID=UPI0027379A42|nr:DUF1269 domain-containing protein [Acidovorax sp. A1169]MDP4076368.1 DUF1269 domain-containing protein [Acidovorax sp. A1169]
MNKMLVSIFDSEMAAQSGLRALRKLHETGDITLYSTGVLLKDANGTVSVKKSLDQGGIGAGVGLAVGSLIGLLGGPMGVALGAVTGTVAGAIRDFWVAGVGRDFIEETDRFLAPGKVALLAEIEEEWVIPVDAALEAVGGRVFRRSRTEMVEEQFDHDYTALKSELNELEGEVTRASGAAKSGLLSRIATTNGRLDAYVQRVKDRVAFLELEAKEKAMSFKEQLSRSKGEATTRIEARAKIVKAAYQKRGAKLSQAWGLAKEALTV